MKPSITRIVPAFIFAIACTVEVDEHVGYRGAELPCDDTDQVVPGVVTKLYEIVATDLIEVHDGVGYEIDPKTGIALLDDGLSGFQCRCASGCQELGSCTTEPDGAELHCIGVCSGTSTDGKTCGFCTWHVVDVPSPTGTPGGLDPTGIPGDKPPGIDPTAGGFDPTFGDDGLPPFDPPPGELDPTK